MEAILDWIQANPRLCYEIVTGFIIFCATIARVTKNEVDNKVVYAVLHFADIFGLSSKPTELKLPDKEEFAPEEDIKK